MSTYDSDDSDGRGADGRGADGPPSAYGRGSSVSAAWAWLTRLVDHEDDWACWSGTTPDLRRSWCGRFTGAALRTDDSVVTDVVVDGPLSEHWAAVGAPVLTAVRAWLSLPAGGWESLGAGSRARPLGVGLELVQVFDHGAAASALLGRPGADGVLPDTPDGLPTPLWAALTMQHDFGTGAWRVAVLERDVDEPRGAW